MGQTALLVDDEESLRDYASAVLCQGGFRVLQAADGLDAVSMLRRLDGAVDVLVTDINMPRMTGIELVKELRINFPGIPVVYISGETPGDGLHDPYAGAVFLRKPFGPEAILEAVRSVMAKARGRLE